ncbi:MAG: class A beta-lactamase, subclass A2 [Bacteroidia bacterium]
MKITLAFIALLLIFSCNNPAPSDKKAVPETVTHKDSNGVKEILGKQIIAIKDSCKGELGVYAKVLESNRYFGYAMPHHYPMQSVFKFPLAMYVLHLVDKGKFKLDDKIHFDKADCQPHTTSPIADKYPNGNVDIPLLEILEHTVEQSDNNGCDRLFRLVGGVDSVNNYIHSLGIQQMNIVATETQMHKDWETQYSNWSSPEAMCQLLQIVFEAKALSPPNNACLMKLMTDCKTGAKRIRGLLPEGTVVAHKTGTGPANKEGINSATNDAGIITLPNGKHLALVVFLMNSKADDAARELTIAKVAKATWDYYSRK